MFEGAIGVRASASIKPGAEVLGLRTRGLMVGFSQCMRGIVEKRGQNRERRAENREQRAETNFFSLLNRLAELL